MSPPMRMGSWIGWGCREHGGARVPGALSRAARFVDGAMSSPKDSIEHLASLLDGADQRPGGSYRSRCPDCREGGFWLTEFSFNCHSCGWQGTLAELAEFFATEEEAETNSFEFVTGAELECRPAPTDLVAGIIAEGALGCVFSKPGCGKTFLAIDMAYSIATGLPWAGRAVQQGGVVYVLGEGAGGVGQRVRAWREAHQVPEVADVHFVLEAVPLMDHGAIHRFVTAIRERTDNPKLVIFDTLARCTLGMEENSARDMGLAIAGADIVRRELGCAVLLIHHTNATGERERGSTALEGAVDVLMWMKSDETGITLSCKKSKDSEAFEDIRLNLTKCLNSAVLTPNMDVGVKGGFLSAGQVVTLRSLHSTAMADGLTVSQWFDVSGQKSSTFYSSRKTLCDRGFVRQDRDGRGARYTLTEAGEAALTPITPTSLQAPLGVTGQITSSNGPPFRGPENGVSLELEEAT